MRSHVNSCSSPSFLRFLQKPPCTFRESQKHLCLLGPFDPKIRIELAFQIHVNLTFCYLVPGEIPPLAILSYSHRLYQIRKNHEFANLMGRSVFLKIRDD